MPQDTRLGDLLVAHLRDQLRRHPAMPSASGHLRARRGFGGREAAQPIPQLFEQAGREPRPDPPGVDESVFLPECQVQGSEPRPSGFGFGEAVNDEIGSVYDTHLQPRAAAPAHVDRVGAFRHHPLQPHRDYVPEHRLALLGNVVRVAQGARARQHVAQQGLALQEREPAQVVVLEGEQVEGVAGRRQRHRRPRDVPLALQSAPLLDHLEGRKPGGVVHNHFAVEDHGSVRQLFQRQCDLGEDPGQVVAVARDQPGRTPPPPRLCQQPIPVVLDFEYPPGPRERRVAPLRVHHLHRVGRHSRPHGSRRLAALPDPRPEVPPFAELLHSQPGEDRVVRVVPRPPLRILVRVVLLDQQPVIVRATLRLHQRPAAPELVSLEVEEQLALLHSFGGVLDRSPKPPIPHDRRPRTVAAFRDHPLEVGVFQRMVLNVHGQPLVRLAGRGPLRHRP